MKRLVRDRLLTAEEAATYNVIRHHDRTATFEQLHHVLQQLKATRESQGLSLVDVTIRTGMEPSILVDLETEQGASPTMETLARYAEALGKRLQISLSDT